MSLGMNMGTGRRSGALAAGVSFTAPPVKKTAPVIAQGGGKVTLVKAGTYDNFQPGVSTLAYTKLLDGIAAGSLTFPYIAAPEDEGKSLSVDERATNNVGTSAAANISNVLEMIGAILRYAELLIGQSLIAYLDTRGVIRAILVMAQAMCDGFGWLKKRAFATVNHVTSDASSPGASDYTIKLVNMAAGGSALLDVAAGDSLIPTNNHWWNTKNNVALTGNPLDVADSPAKLARDAYAALQANPDIKSIRWGQGNSDIPFLMGSQANRDLYAVTGVKLFIYLAGAVGKPNMPTFIHRFGRHEKLADAGVQYLVDIQNKWTADYVWISNGLDEYDLRTAAASVIDGCSFAAGATVINTANTSELGVNDRIEAFGGQGASPIDHATNITAITSGVSFTISRPTLAAGDGIRLYRVDDTHFYPGSDIAQPVDTDSNGDGTLDQHNLTDGFYEMGRRAVWPVVNFFKNGVRRQTGYGPKITGIIAKAGEPSFELPYQLVNPGATALTRRDGGAIDGGSRPMFAITNNGASLFAQNIVDLGGKLRVDVVPNIVGGTLDIKVVPGAMNKLDTRLIIMDNGTQRLPLQRATSATDPNLSITLATVPIDGAIDSVLPGIVAQWDATMKQSYPGYEQVLNNVIALPADGSAQNIYNLRRGAFSSVSADDPSFTGTAGDPAARFRFDGGDFFETFQNNTAFLNALHRDTQDFTIIMAFKLMSATGYLLSTQNSTSSAGIALQPVASGSSFKLQLTVRGDNANANCVSTRSIPYGTDCLAIVSHNATTKKTKFYLNQRSGGEEVGHSFAAATGAATVNLHVGARSDSAGFVGDGFELAGLAFASYALNTDADAAAVCDYFNPKHGKTYA